jgi:hypothetical protein
MAQGDVHYIPQFYHHPYSYKDCSIVGSVTKRLLSSHCPRAIQFSILPLPPRALDPFSPGGGRLGWGEQHGLGTPPACTPTLALSRLRGREKTDRRGSQKCMTLGERCAASLPCYSNTGKAWSSPFRHNAMHKATSTIDNRLARRHDDSGFGGTRLGRILPEPDCALIAVLVPRGTKT